MLNPLVYCKTVHARNAYLKAGNGERKAAREKLFDIAGDRHCFYKFEGRPELFRAFQPYSPHCPD